MRELVFATNNQYKAEEVGNLLSGQYKVLSLKAIGCDEDIPETGSTFAENAALKSKYVFEHFSLNCFGDDSGLQIDALNDEPGIFSARYSGSRNDKENLDFVLQKMLGVSNRNARFTTVICLYQGGQNYFFEGSVEGTIRAVPVGDKGFGYDPIFQPNGYAITFAEMTTEQKNQISHRAIAMKKLITFLKGQPSS
ncbi:RdgB/HAM1 family non-canonical purine NTP pyrophosphatase [Pedobacter sp. JCM 36344]|uniref:RdgB/HAM1 family non-canonical purine NTP pyrophosphatase n=1 Tax=Pedobacter sp. JCM 36344 TaxID=3374280 RepID=UPI00397B3F95